MAANWTFPNLLDELRIEYRTEGHHHCRTGWLQLDCPFCGKGSQQFHMGYNIDKRYVNCWRCGPHRLLETLMHLTDESKGRCIELLKKLGELTVSKQVEQEVRSLQLPKGLGELGPRHVKYLEKRGYNTEELKALWGLRGIGLHSYLSWRIFIPVMYQGKVVSWTTRSLKSSGVRYMSAQLSQEAINHKTLLYGEDYCRHSCIIHEGPFDVWRTGPGAVCTFGTGYTRPQVLRMSKYPVRAVCYDNEPEAQRRARALCEMLCVLPGDTYNVTLSGKDASDSPEKEIQELRQRFLA